MLASKSYEDQLGQNQVHLSCVDSTNNYAANLLKTGDVVSGTVILADEQTNGRGQRGSAWQSKPGMNLQFSAIWLPKNINTQNHRVLNFAVSVSIIRFLKKKGIEGQIKWPNDILVNGRKICGVLIENNVRGNFLSSSVIGVGLNVNQTDFGNLKAASIKGETGEFTPIQSALDGLLLELNKVLELVSSNQIDDLESIYFKHLFGYNTELQFEDMNGLFRGEIIGVDDTGNLKVQTNGVIKSYGIKEVKFLF